MKFTPIFILTLALMAAGCGKKETNNNTTRTEIIPGYDTTQCAAVTCKTSGHCEETIYKCQAGNGAPCYLHIFSSERCGKNSTACEAAEVQGDL